MGGVLTFVGGSEIAFGVEWRRSQGHGEGLYLYSWMEPRLSQMRVKKGGSLSLLSLPIPRSYTDALPMEVYSRNLVRDKVYRDAVLASMASGCSARDLIDLSRTMFLPDVYIHNPDEETSNA